VCVCVCVCVVCVRAFTSARKGEINWGCDDENH
jgi:hypothetical protein